ncbi:MAG: hypothetical protein COV36_00150 [Alphaproteobacteria bacterium CG11_big_fil_rev_8_21_14_0_20_44_7]|nr:MAG: hypothetical protein COV36_00150 [Alphaproteobacteria bacterium CG11_big_fil_rev_8_21_14_0_20_44_7]
MYDSDTLSDAAQEITDGGILDLTAAEFQCIGDEGLAEFLSDLFEECPVEMSELILPTRTVIDDDIAEAITRHNNIRILDLENCQLGCVDTPFFEIMQSLKLVDINLSGVDIDEAEMAALETLIDDNPNILNLGESATVDENIKEIVADNAESASTWANDIVATLRTAGRLREVKVDKIGMKLKPKLKDILTQREAIEHILKESFPAHAKNGERVLTSLEGIATSDERKSVTEGEYKRGGAVERLDTPSAKADFGIC